MNYRDASIEIVLSRGKKSKLIAGSSERDAMPSFAHARNCAMLVSTDNASRTSRLTFRTLLQTVKHSRKPNT